MALPKVVQENILGCLCTVNDEGSPSGATLFYAIKDDKLYFLTHKFSQKVKSLIKHPNVCFVVADHITYRQVQMYGTTKIVNNPEVYLPLLEKNIESHSKKTDAMIPYMDIRDEGGPVVVEFTPQKHVHFKSGDGISVDDLSN